MSDKAKAARRAVADFRRDAAAGRKPKPWQLIRWIEILAAEIEAREKP